MSNYVSLIGDYVNGNYRVSIYNDGTKIRETLNEDDTRFIPQFAENCDVKITDKCDGGCPMCYEGCTIEGRHADLRNTPLNLDSLHPYTEMALNGNDLTHPDLVWFLKELKKRKVIANITVNQKHFERNLDLIQRLVVDGLIHGLGISLVDPTPEFINKVKMFKNAVIHVINGVITKEQFDAISDQDLKVLILGYKPIGRGGQYLDKNLEDIVRRIDYTYVHLPELVSRFSVLSFDNLAIRQLNVERIVGDNWDEFYMGDDGDFTFYIDLVKGQFSRNSIAPNDERYPLMSSIDDMFKKIRDEKSATLSE